MSSLPIEQPSPADGDEIGRRARKKLETRRALVGAALELFDEQGVDGTTVDEIADAVDVSARTFHRYFPTKEDVLFADADERCAEIAAFLASRPQAEPIIETLRAAAHLLVDSYLTDPADARRRMTLVRSTPLLRAMSLQHSDVLSDLVAAHAGSRLGVDPMQSLPRLLAACTLAALRIAREQWLDDIDADYHAGIDRCFVLVGDLATASATPTDAGRAPRAS